MVLSYCAGLGEFGFERIGLGRMKLKDCLGGIGTENRERGREQWEGRRDESVADGAAGGCATRNKQNLRTMNSLAYCTYISSKRSSGQPGGNELSNGKVGYLRSDK